MYQNSISDVRTINFNVIVYRYQFFSAVPEFLWSVSYIDIFKVSENTIVSLIVKKEKENDINREHH